MAASVHGFPAPLYYAEPAAIAVASTGDTVELVGDEARHAASVRRVRVGEQISVGDGCGRVVFGKVASVDPRAVSVTVSGVVARQPQGLELVLVQALAKGDRDELAIQAATEIGVDRVVPWAAARSVSQWVGAKREKGRTRWTSIVREAAKQSLRATVPVVSEVGDLAGVIGVADAVIVLDPTATVGFADLVRTASTTPMDAVGTMPSSLAIVVGPEGGIEPAERTAFVAAGARIARLGDTVLRTSTAGPVAVALALSTLGRWDVGHVD